MDKQDGAPIYEAEILIRGKVSIRLESDPDDPENLEKQMAFLEVTFDSGREGQPPLISGRKLRADEMGLPLSAQSWPNYEDHLKGRAKLWASSVTHSLRQIFPIVFNNLTDLVVEAAKSRQFKTVAYRPGQLRAIAVLVKNLKRIAGIKDDAPKGPKAQEFTLAQLMKATRDAKKGKTSFKGVHPEDAAAILGVSARTFERALRKHKTSWPEIKEKAFTLRGK